MTVICGKQHFLEHFFYIIHDLFKPVKKTGNPAVSISRAALIYYFITGLIQ